MSPSPILVVALGATVRLVEEKRDDGRLGDLPATAIKEWDGQQLCDKKA